MLLAPGLHRELAREGLRRQNIRALETFANSVVKILIGSTNSVMHQQAVTTEAEADVYRRLVDIADQMPLAAVRPNGEATIEDYEEADGARDEEAFEPPLRTDALTLTGRTVAANLGGITEADEETIRPMGRPLGRWPTIMLIRGKLRRPGTAVPTGRPCHSARRERPGGGPGRPGQPRRRRRPMGPDPTGSPRHGHALPSGQPAR